jgi:hypothetical protein
MPIQTNILQGKTDVAIMAIIRVLMRNVVEGFSSHPSGFNINRDAFKIIYVAPMKALAAEITRKFGKRLAWLNIKVRELTGDMQLTRAEIAETQIIVTTPEKWDVVTRKPTGEGELASVSDIVWWTDNWLTDISESPASDHRRSASAERGPRSCYRDYRGAHITPGREQSISDPDRWTQGYFAQLCRRQRLLEVRNPEV